ncbi:MAG: phosphate ABC transporter permease PstA [Erysipelothrix sp.]|nr:phosphate ABC transporter permease PstA [Erysipelothrix sp.]
MKQKLLRLYSRLSIFVVMAASLFLIFYILINGIPYLKPSLFSLTYTSENVSMLPAIITTIYIVLMTLTIALPIGVATAIYLVEYAARDSRLAKIMKISTEALSGIPSIIYGLFGFLFFVTALSFSYSMVAGALTLAIMILPFIIRTTQEALIDVPDSYREAALGLGSSKLYMIFKVVLPSASAGILSGIILSIGRIVGESAALIYTLGTVAKIPDGLFSSGRTLSIHMWALSSEGFNTNEAYATAVILLVLVFAMNGASMLITKKLMKGNNNETTN